MPHHAIPRCCLCLGREEPSFTLSDRFDHTVFDFIRAGYYLPPPVFTLRVAGGLRLSL